MISLRIVVALAALVALMGACCASAGLSFSGISKKLGSRSLVKMTPEERAQFEAFKRSQQQSEDMSIVPWRDGPQARPPPSQPAASNQLVPYNGAAHNEAPPGRPQPSRPPASRSPPAETSNNGPKLLEYPKQEMDDVDKEEMEMSDDLLSLLTKQLFVWSDKLSPEEALEKLEAVSPYYHRFAGKVKVDTNQLVSFSEEAEENCHNKRFYSAMVESLERVKRHYPALTKYMEQCIHNYQFLCESEQSLSEQVAEFRNNNQQGVQNLELLMKTMERNRDIFQPWQLGVNTLLDLQDRYPYIQLGGARVLVETCGKVKQFANDNHLDQHDPAWRADENIKAFVKHWELCKNLETNHYMDYIHRK